MTRQEKREKAATDYMRRLNIIWKFDGTMFMRGKKQNVHMTGYYSKMIKKILNGE
jgi:hypothetical protein